MFPHKKYFSSVPCPENEDGDCVRPYCHFFHRFKSKAKEFGTHEHRSSYQSWQQVSQTSHVQQVSQTTSHVQHNNEEYQSYEATSCSYSTAAHAAHIANKSLVEAPTAPQDGDDSEDEQLQIDEQSSAENCGGDARLDPLVEAPPATNDVPIPTNTGQPSAVDSIIQSDVLQKLVMESVKKFLSESQLLASIEPSVLASQIDTSAIVSSLSSQQSANASSQNTASKENKRRLYLRPPGIPDYKPTPIRELQKRKSVGGSSDKSRVNVSQADHESDTTDFSSPEEDGQDLPANLDSEAVTAEGASSSLKEDEPGKINDLPCGNDAELEADRIQNEADKKSETSTRVSSHVLVPVQVTRKTWKPSSLKATKPNTISGVLETTKTLNSSEGKLPTADDLSKPPAVVPPTAQTSTQLMPDDSSSHTNDVPPSAQPAKQVDNDEEINSLISTAAATDAVVEPGKVGTSTCGSKDIDSPTSKQCDDMDDMEEAASQPRPDNKCSSEKARDSLDDAESDFESEYSARSRSSSGDRSSSRERRRRRRKRKREKKAKHKRSKSRKKQRKHSFSDDSDLEKDASGNEIDDELNSDEENAESSAVKREIASEEDDGDSSEVPLSKKRRRLDESDTSGSKKPKSKTKKRKRSKHRKKSKRHRRRRYRSSSDSDSDWESSSSSSRRSRKRRRRDIDLSFIKPDPEDVIDLTVIKDESDSSDSPCVKTAADVINHEGLNEDKKQPIVTESVVNATDKDSETKESVFSSQPELKHRTASADSSNTIPFEDKISSPGSGPPEPPSGGSPCSQEPEEPSPNTNTTEIPPLKKTAALFSSKTKTLKEISIFDSLLDGGASSRIKTVKKKCVEELSSSSATPSAAEEEERLKKFTKTFTSRSSTTSTRHSSKEVESSSTSTHVSKSLVTSSSPSSSIGRKSSSSSKSNSRNTLDGDKIPNKSKSEDPSSKSSSSSNRSKNYKSHSESSSKSSKDRHDRSSSRSSVHKSSSHSSSRKHSSSSSSHRQSADPTKKDTSHKDTSHKDAPHKDTRQKDSRSSRKEKDLKNNASFEPAPNACASSQESEGVSDRDIFNFNNGPSHTSQSSDDEASAEGRDALSPLPDLSALDSIPDEDWDKLMSLDDGGAAEDECLQLYNDFTPPAPRPPAPPKKVEAEEAGVCGVQRVARPGAVGNLLGRPRPATARLSPHQVMMQRYAKLKQEQAALKQQLEEHKQHLSTQHHARVSGSSSSGADSAAKTAADAALPLGSSRKPRVGAVSNVSALLTASKQRLHGSPSSASSSSSRPSSSHQSSSSTRPSPSSASRFKAAAEALRAKPVATTASAGAKGVKRVAHVPKVEVLERPVIASEFGGKVPQNIRQRYLNSFIDEALKFSECPSDAFKIALCEEKVCYGRAGSRAVYLSLAVNTTKRLRSAVVSDQAKEMLHDVELPAAPATAPSLPSHPVNPNHRVQSHFSTLAGGGQKGSWSIEKPAKTDVQAVYKSLTGAKLYQFVQRYLMTKEQLLENGYPHAHPDVKGKAVCKLDSRAVLSPSPTERYCSRCNALFVVDDWGFPKAIVSCAYHWGRANKRRVATGLETRYSCCMGDLQSEGCCLASTHVSDNLNPDNYTGFVSTLPPNPGTSSHHAVYALDCEMCYTTGGSELTRVTVVDHDSRVVYESFVQPHNQILDYNTRFSGITEEQLEDVTTTLRDVQAALLTLFSSSTVLVGHSLESDFRALKLIHHTVVDTSVLFPHKMGPPYKRALRNLASEHLKKIIQNDVSGHDSAEDAITCMELLHWKIKEDLKTDPV